MISYVVRCLNERWNRIFLVHFVSFLQYFIIRWKKKMDELLSIFWTWNSRNLEIGSNVLSLLKNLRFLIDIETWDFSKVKVHLLLYRIFTSNRIIYSIKTHIFSANLCHAGCQRVAFFCFKLLETSWKHHDESSNYFLKHTLK